MGRDRAIKLNQRSQSFTLIELIVVIIVVGILAAIGLSQYSATVEKSRMGEAKIRLGVMRKLAYEYYLNNGSLTGLTNSDLGVDNTCTSSNYYRFMLGDLSATRVNLFAYRCTVNGKTPNATRGYYFYLSFNPGTGCSMWNCYYPDDGSACFGLPHSGCGV